MFRIESVELTVDQVLALAPDASSAAAGRKLGTAKPWRNLGRADVAIWGECQGSALYQVRVDLRDLAIKCSCPSRKFPCKHGLGLLLLAAATPGAFESAAQPEWVADWIGKRSSRVEGQATPKPVATDRREPPETAGERASKRADQRLKRVAAGIDALDVWLDDLIQNGLASAETQPAGFWEQQAARLVDAQAPGLAARVRRLAGIPNATRDWPERLLAELGRLALLTHAFRRLDALDPVLQEDVRAAIGWSLGQEEVVARGEAISDDWLVLGHLVTVEDRLRAQRTWLLGMDSGRYALVLQFAAGSAPFSSTLVPGTLGTAELVFWPSAWPQRALVRERSGTPASISRPFPASRTIERFLDDLAMATARQPWLDRLPCALSGVVPVVLGERWFVRGRCGTALPLSGDDHWRLLALSGGMPVDVAGEWDGDTLVPLGAFVDGGYYLLNGG